MKWNVTQVDPQNPEVSPGYDNFDIVRLFFWALNALLLKVPDLNASVWAKAA